MKRMSFFRIRRGVTLTELVVAISLTSVVILASWRFFGNASNQMSVFVGMSITDERIAFAADMIAADARMGGMLSTPFSTNDPLVCPRPPTELRAVMIDDTAGSPRTDLGLNTQIAPDECTFLTPVSTDIYHPQSISGNIIAFTADDLPTDADTFDALFDNHILRITAPNGFGQFVVVQATDFGNSQVLVTPAPVPLEDTGVCGFQGIGGPDHEITVVGHVRYRIMDNPDDADETVLVREELRADLGGIVPGGRLVVAENIVDLQCWGTGVDDVGGTGDFEDDLTLDDTSGSADFGEDSDETELLRIFNFTLSGRTDREFRNFGFIAKTNEADLMTTYDVDGAVNTAALVLMVGNSVEISTLAARQLF